MLRGHRELYWRNRVSGPPGPRRGDGDNKNIMNDQPDFKPEITLIGRGTVIALICVIGTPVYIYALCYCGLSWHLDFRYILVFAGFDLICNRLAELLEKRFPSVVNRQDIAGRFDRVDWLFLSLARGRLRLLDYLLRVLGKFPGQDGVFMVPLLIFKPGILVSLMVCLLQSVILQRNTRHLIAGFLKYALVIIFVLPHGILNLYAGRLLLKGFRRVSTWASKQIVPK